MATLNETQLPDQPVERRLPMATILNPELFTWQEIDELGDLERLVLVLNNMPDEGLMIIMEVDRGNGRNDYPVRPVWNSIIAGIIYGHESIESLRRELARNPQLCFICGFSMTRKNRVPPAWVYTRFLKKLLNYEEEIGEIFNILVKDLMELLPDFGTRLAVDGKALNTFANPGKETERESDGRRDTDANWGKKTYKGKKADGSLWKTVKKWFGYKLHLVVDSDFELPVAYEVTKASGAEIPQAKKLVEHMDRNIPGLLERCEYLSADKGYDDTDLIQALWKNHGVKPVIDIRNMWQDGEESRLVQGQYNVVYDYRGTVSCFCPETGEIREMSYGGFEKDRDTLKYRCPAVHYGIRCKGKKECPVGRALRIKRSFEPRVFSPLARSSYAWEREYKKRTAVERVNSRLDVSFGFEEHFIRGLKKMKLRIGLALIVMLTMAVGRIRENQNELMRSLVKKAA